MNVLPIVPRLPNGHLLLIGEVITSWALLEHELRLTVFLLLGLDNKRGRLAVRSARAKETIDLIADLMHQSKLRSKTTRLDELGKLLEELENRRNTLAHNIWLKDEDGILHIQSLTGVWPQKDGKRLKRRVLPAGIPVTEHNLADLVSATRQCIAAVLRLRSELMALLESAVPPEPDPSA
jgi:hypothetical protein